MDKINELAAAHGLKVIEDCAQAHGAEYKKRRVGALGHIGCFSFYPGKNLGAYGDAGAILTNDGDIATRCRMIANHGRIAKYDHEFEGRNSRLDAIQAAILTIKLSHLEAWTESRISLASYYTERLSSTTGIMLPHTKPWARHVFHLYVIRTQDRERIRLKLQEHDIQCGIHYPVALPKLKAYAYLNQAGESMRANRIDSALLSLPIGEHLRREQVAFVASMISGD